jgi:hypothetical protein
VSPFAVFPIKILPAVPTPTPLFGPAHPVMVSKFPAHETAFDAAKVIVWTPVPRAIVELAFKFKVPTVSEKPAAAPVLKVPPFNTTLLASGITPAAPSRKVPLVMVVVPE